MSIFQNEAVRDDIRRLQVEYATEDEFQSEYYGNISNGGIFVATDEPVEIGRAVMIDMVLAFSDDRFQLEGQVVHCIPPELRTTGATPGVAIQFLESGEELRCRFAHLIEEQDDAVPLDESAEGTGRRRSRRTRARVAAQIHDRDGAPLDGRTRDLSSTGVLVSVAGEPIPVGDVVQLALRHPTSGESMEIEGVVARHVEAEDGRITAVGIEFDPTEQARGDVSRFVGDLQSVEHSRHLGGIRGSIAELGIENLLQMFGTCAPCGSLTVSRGSEEGIIVFEAGMLRAAHLGAVRGRKALARMLGWQEGSFEFEARLDDVEPTGEAIPLDAAVLDAMRLIDEERALSVDSIPRNVPMRAADDVDADAGGLTKTEAAILDLAAVGMTVARMLDIIPEPDAEVLPALLSLLDRGLVFVQS